MKWFADICHHQSWFSYITYFHPFLSHASSQLLCVYIYNIIDSSHNFTCSSLWIPKLYQFKHINNNLSHQQW